MPLCMKIFFKSRKQEPCGVCLAVVCSMLICSEYKYEYKSLCKTLNHNGYEGAKLFSLSTGHELFPGGKLPYEEYMGVCHELGSHFQEKIPKRVYQFFVKIPERAIISVRNSR